MLAPQALLPSVTSAADASQTAGGFDWWSVLWIILAIIGVLILLAALIVGLVLFLLPAGIFAGVKGSVNALQARGIKKRAVRQLEEMKAKHDIAHQSMQQRVYGFNLQKISAVTETIGRFADWMQRSRLNVNRLAHDAADAPLIDAIEDLPKHGLESGEIADILVKAGVGAAAAGLAAAGAYGATLATASAIGTASTGTAISSLSGAAATNARLAWLGGGTIAAGGGGMAAGNMVLAVITVAPAIAIAGFTAGILGSKEKTKSKQFAAEVDVACAQIEAVIKLWETGTRRIDELSTVLSGLTERLSAATNRLEVLDFDSDLHVDHFRQAMLLVRSVREVNTVQVFGLESRDLTEASDHLLRRYR